MNRSFSILEIAVRHNLPILEVEKFITSILGEDIPIEEVKILDIEIYTFLSSFHNFAKKQSKTQPKEKAHKSDKEDNKYEQRESTNKPK